AAWHACRQKSRRVAKPGASSLCMETTNTSVLANVSSPSSSLFSNLHRYIATETAQPIAQIGRADESIADAAVDAQPVGDSPEGRSLRLGGEEVVAHGGPGGGRGETMVVREWGVGEEVAARRRH